MSNFFKNKYKLLVVVGVFMLVITLLSVTYAQNYLGNNIFDQFLNKTESEPEPPVQQEPEPEPEPAPDFQEEEPDPTPVVFTGPAYMRGGFLTPGVEYLTSPEDSEDTVKTQVAGAVKAASNYTLNTILINTSYKDQVIYKTADSDTFTSGFDVMDLVVQEARAQDLYVYGVFDLSYYKNGSFSTLMAKDSGQHNSLFSNIQEFAEKYDLDGVLLKGYQTETTAESYSVYSKLGGGLGLTNYMRQTPQALLQTGISGVKSANPSLQVGLLADPVWANIADDEEGSQTTASYAALTQGNADTKAYVEEELVDFVLVNAYGSMVDQQAPFENVVTWWTHLMEGKDIPLYIMQASSKVGGGDAGWNGGDELIKQAAYLDDTVGVGGNAFDSLGSLMGDAGGATTNLMKYYKEDIEPEYILTQLEMTKPAETTYTTNETQVVFTGATDPTQPITINDKQIQTDQSGYFTVLYELNAGLNSFTIGHKDKSINYAITRQVNILTGVSPTGAITTDGSMDIRIAATAYEGATVTASVGGSTITLTEDNSVVDEQERDSSYKVYTGVYTAPGATEALQNLGAISVTASWNGETKSLAGATITVNKKAKIEDGVPVRISVDQATTFPGGTLDNIPRADTFPLPLGALDYAVGEEIEYKGVAYTLLASGLRVKSSDISPSSDYASGNVVKGLTVSSEGGFTYLTLEVSQKVSYNVKYSNNGLSIALSNTDKVPENASLSQNPLFTAANWEGSALQLPFVKTGGFMGFKGYYNDSGQLVFRFNNPPSSIAGARIAIDPGHGGGDVGALGFLADYPEKIINLRLAQTVAAELGARGATVLLLDTSGNMSLENRVAQAEAFNADLFLSIHNNTAPNPSAKGTEVYYFYPFSYALAYSASANVSGQLQTANRGAKQSYYHVTLSSQFPSVLVECGFISNKEEYEKLIRTRYHERIALGLADGISGALSAAYTGIGGGGPESIGGSVVTGEDPKPQPPSAEGVTLNRSTLSLQVGKTAALTATVTPADASQALTWSSSDAGIVSVDSGGGVKGLKEGTAAIKVTTGDGYTATCTVTVTKGSAPPTGQIPVEEVYLSHREISIEVGKTFTLEAEAVPDNATNTTLTWSSDDTKVATVNSSGVVTGVQSGIALVTAQSGDGESASCTVQVGATDDGALSGAHQIDFVSPPATMYAGTSQTLKVATDGGKVVSNNLLIWESTDNSLATVDRNGVVTARAKEGTVTIHVRNKADTLFDSVKITVTKDRVTATGISLSTSEVIVELNQKSSGITATVQPSNASHQNIQWRISNSNIAKVDENGVVTGIRTGTTTLIASISGSNTQATCRVQVVEKGQAEIYDMYLDAPSQMEMGVGDTDYFVVYFDPEAIPNKKVTWTSSHSKVVSVDGEGNITAIAQGRATITATSVADPSLKATCSIQVFE